MPRVLNLLKIGPDRQDPDKRCASR